MTRAAHSLLEPPRWTHALLRFALPCDSLRDAILGDLHEEFTHDLADVGVRRARLRHVSRTAGIAARALFDSAICRSWESTEPAGEAGRGARTGAANAAGGSPPVVLRRTRAIVGAASFPILALFVVVVGVVVNTMMFSAAQPQSPRATSAAGIGGVAVLVACVAIAATVLCVGPRWRRKRLRGA